MPVHPAPCARPTAARGPGRRTTSRRVLSGLVVAAVAVAVTPVAAQAHEKWFLDDPESFATDWSFVARPLVLLALVAVVAVTLLWRWAAVRFLPVPEIGLLRPLGRLAPWAPRLLGVHLGISLLALAVSGRFLTFDLELHDLPAGQALALVEGLLGVWFISGVRLRPAAVLLVAVGPAALLLTGPVGLLSAADLLGIAGFLAVLPPGQGAWGRVELDPRRTRLAVGLLRLGVGVALITLAFAEKLANPDMARATLAAYPQLDVFAAVGIDLPATAFVAVAGATELLFGLLVLSAAAPQVVVLVAAVPFNATLLLFGQTELLGHLPVYGVFLTLLVLGSDPSTARDVRALPTRASLRRLVADVRSAADRRQHRLLPVLQHQRRVLGDDVVEGRDVVQQPLAEAGDVSR